MKITNWSAITHKLERSSLYISTTEKVEKMRIETLFVNFDHHNKRLDAFISECLELSRERVKRLIQDDQVQLKGGAIMNKPAQKVETDTYIEVTIPPAESSDITPEDIPLDVLFEDDQVIVVDKPYGLTVHPAAGTPRGTLVNALLFHCRDNLSGIGGVERPGIVHRLDKDTSGVIVVAKTDEAHQSLTEQFKNHTTNRRYATLVYGTLPCSEGVITGNIGRHPKDRKKMTVLQSGGKEAVTTFRVLKEFNEEISLVQLKLRTGRTHQIRVHLTNEGYPIVGDPVYGKAKHLKNTPPEAEFLIKQTERQLLHAFFLAFDHPVSGERLTFQSPLPEDMTDILDRM